MANVSAGFFYHNNSLVLQFDYQTLCRRAYICLTVIYKLPASRWDYLVGYYLQGALRACFKNKLEQDCERGGVDGEARRRSIFGGNL